MANFTAADVKRLRELTGAGMLDCKNALSEADGDFDKAVEALRIKGAKDVGKRAERATAEGLVAAKDGALIELNSETDFVAKNAEFQKLADEIVAAAAASKAADVDALKAASISAGDKTVEQAIADLSAKIGEKLELRRVAFFDGTVETYLHKRAADLPPAVGVLVDAQQRFLLTSRPAGKVYAGYWEFPGGKLEAGETVEQALRRELHEEIGITIAAAHPWHVIMMDYPHARVRLNFCKVFEWTGAFEMREGQHMAWESLPVASVPVPARTTSQTERSARKTCLSPASPSAHG